MKRRDFLKKATMAATAAGTATVAAPYVMAAPKYHWRMVSTWPLNLPLFQTGLVRYAKRVKALSNGQLNIQVFGGGELVPPLATFDAVSKGTVEAGGSASFYWEKKTPAAQWFTSVPFGMNAQGMNAWLYAGDGLQLWEETYAPFDIIPRPYGNSGVQMGGWFNKEINSIEDYQGLRMRMPGLGAKVLAKVGSIPVLLPASEIFGALKNGTVDAAEWVGPEHDLKLELYKVAKYYYTPGWQEPGSALEIIFNKKSYQKLPKNLQMILDIAAAESNVWMLAESDTLNGTALETLITKHKIKVSSFPPAVLKILRKHAMEVRAEEAAKDAMAKKVHQSFNLFQDQVGIWGSISERSYFDTIAKKYILT